MAASLAVAALSVGSAWGAASASTGVPGSPAAPASPEAATGPIAATGTWFDGLGLGVCFELTLDGGGSVDFGTPPAPVDCAQPHGHEVVARVPLGDGALPPDADKRVLATCEEETTAFLGGPAEESGLFSFSVWPDAADWEAGVRDGLCIIVGSGMIGTAASGGLTAPGEVIAAWWQPASASELWLFDGGTGEPVRSVVDGSLAALLGPPAWSPDGSSLLFAVQSAEGDTAVHQVSRDGGQATVLVDAPGRQDAAVYSPDGSRLAYISNEAGGSTTSSWARWAARGPPSPIIRSATPRPAGRPTGPRSCSGASPMA